MDTFVLIPEEFSLHQTPNENLRVITNRSLTRGTRFSPFQGTLRTDDKLSFFLDREKNERYHYSNGFRVSSWIKFLKETSQMSGEVNLMEIVTPGGQILYEARTTIDIEEELVLFSPKTPLGLGKAIKEAIFEQTMRALMREVPLDLSTSLFHRMVRIILIIKPACLFYPIKL